MSTYTTHNERISGIGLQASAASIWNPRSYSAVRAAIRKAQCTICHFNNTFPLISPSAYYAAKAEGTTVVQTVHNYRFLCPAATFFRDGRVCEDCTKRAAPWPSVVHGCYRENRAATTSVAAMLTVHRLARSLTHKVDAMIALTPFGKSKLLENGFPADQVHVKPNFVLDDPGMGAGAGGAVLYVGRISPEKGVDTLLKAWRRMGAGRRLQIVGEGPQKLKLQRAFSKLDGVEWFGHLNIARAIELMKEAEVLVVPSVWHEPFGRVVVEGFATGLPAIVSRVGGLQHTVKAGKTGYLFTPGDAEELAATLERWYALPDRANAMRREARRAYTTLYSEDAGHRELIRVYELAMQRARCSAPSRTEPVARSL